MRLPQSWDDKNLLNDEPFLTEFALREAHNESRSRKGGRNWNESISEKLFEHGLEAAQTWLGFAFSVTSKKKLPVRNKTIGADRTGLHVFIEFYWRLYPGGEESERLAEQYLRWERSKRGFEYMLERSARAEVQADGLKTRFSRLSTSASSGRKHLKHQKRAPIIHLDDGYDAENSQAEDDIRDYPPPVYSALRHNDPDTSMSPRQPAAELQEGEHSNVISPSDATLQADCEAPVVRKRKALTERPSTSSAHSSPSERDVPPEHPPKCSASAIVTTTVPFHEDVAAPDSSPLSELPSESDNERAQQIVALKKKKKKKKQCAVAAVRRQPSRHAAHPERLSQMMTRENKYGKGSKRAVLDDSLSDGDRDTQVRPSVPPRLQLGIRGKRGKKASASIAPSAAAVALVGGTDKRASSPRDEDHVPEALANIATPAASATLGLPHTLRSSSVHPSAVPPFPIPTSGDTAATRAPALRKTTKKPKKYRKQASVQLPEPPKKRRRSNAHDRGIGGDLAHILMYTKAPTGSPKVQPRRSVRLLPQADASQVDSASANVASSDSPTNVTPALHANITHPPDAVQQASKKPTASSTRVLRPRKRSRDMLDATNADGQQDSQPAATKQRPILPLPKKRTPRASKSGTGPIIRIPKGRQSTSGCVASTADVDRILRDAATEAIEVQNIARSFPGTASDWDGEDEEHARPPDWSDSDDEPLARQLSLSVAQSRSSNGKPPAPEDPIMTPPFPHFSPQDFEASPVNVGRVEPMPVKPTLKDVGIEHPPIWAQSRQEVCESFDHFRSYQGGVYFLKDMVKGYLLSAFSANRDIFEHDGRLIVSHGGGKAQGSHVEDGKSKAHEADDQLAEDKSVRALLNTYALRRPVVLLIDDKYTLFPYNLGAEGYTYVVLGFYHITHAWAEPQPASNSRGYVVRYKFAFQWCQRQGVPWWIKHKSFPSVSSTISIPVSSGGLTPAESHAERRSSYVTISAHHAETSLRCPHCGTISPTVYRKGWTCLKPGCIAFWRTTEGKVLSPSTEYAENFLQLLSCNHCNPQDLRPPTPLGNPSDGVTTSRAFCKGWHCTSCGRLSCRYKWEHWECRNCGQTHGVHGKMRDRKEFWGQNPPENLHTHWIAHDSGIIFERTRMYMTETGHTNLWYEYVLPNNHGKIYLIGSTTLTNKDADDVFAGYQKNASEGKLAFRRWPLRMHKCRGTLLTNYFSQNSGEPYQYVGGTENTVPWDEAPQPVRGALELIKRRMQLALGKSSTFNEVLSAAYMEKQSMAFHSDSERGLGPVVASLSLGSAAFMHFRPLVTGKSAKPGNALTLYLRHGDVVVMEGAEVQTCYEHTVVPRNFRIAATARSIGLNDAPNSGC